MNIKNCFASCLLLTLGACTSQITTGGDLGRPVDGGGATADATSPAAGDGGCGGNVMTECQTDADCNDGDPTTTDKCQLSGGGEFPTGTCLHIACDGGLSCASQAVDPGCTAADAGIVYPPFVALHPPDVPTSCANGFQLGDAQGAPTYVINAKTPAGSRALTLDLDFATYTAPDGLLITGVDGSCKEYVLFSSCRLRTADQPEMQYTDGLHRPADIAIRQFHLMLRQGTTRLTVDFSRVVSPMYVQVLGLCDFNLPPAQGVGWFSPVP
jgi:hypothetical protein